MIATSDIANKEFVITTDPCSKETLPDYLSSNQTLIVYILKTTLDMTAKINSHITPDILVYNESTFSYDLKDGIDTIEGKTTEETSNLISSIKKVFIFQETLSESQREQIYLIVKDYVLTHPNREDRSKALNRTIKDELGITVKGPYVVYLVDIIERSFDISLGQDPEHSYIQNYPHIKCALESLNSRLVIDKDNTLALVNTLSSLLSPFHDEMAEPNGVISTADFNGINVSHNSTNIYCSYDSLIEVPLMKDMSEYDGKPIPVYISTYTSKRTGKIFISEIIKVNTVKHLLEDFKTYIANGDFITANRYFNIIMEVLYPYLKGDLMPFCLKIRRALEPARLSAIDRIGIKINFSETSYQVTYTTSQKAYRNIKRNVRALQVEDNYNEALQILIDGLCSDDITAKKKSDIYKTLVETYSKMEQFDNAININKQWINHCVANCLASDKRIARMYTLLAKLQSSVTGYEEDALESLKMAMQYDPDSEFYTKLYATFIETFESRK